MTVQLRDLDKETIRDALNAPYRVIIAGGRNLASDAHYAQLAEFMHKVWYEAGGVTEVLSGGCRGADLLGEDWAACNNVPVRRFPADWRGLGTAAGPIRNKQMAAEADALVLIWSGRSKGSASMKHEAQRRGLMIYEVIV